MFYNFTDIVLFTIKPALILLGSRWFTVDIITAVKNNDLMGYLCLLVTTILSIISWGVIAYKCLHLRQATKQTNVFVDACMAGRGNLDRAFQLAANYPDSPLAQILREAYLEVEMENWYVDEKTLSVDGRFSAAKINIDRIMEQTASNEIRHLESGLNFLATTANVCPLIGLFGTVWGILGAFQAVAKEGSAAISSLGPGVSTALMTTVAGLIAAIPAVIFYNFLLGKVQNLVRRMDSFSMEISNIIQKQIIKLGTKN
ncbi:MotA/TolQ/ExbB proton channel family protein [Candidatus Sumerlaeota bacterium]|nr:MotA/TolQ/ExbB proton channel family protein [Candidatus Sumerlaeota bacterium]